MALSGTLTDVPLDELMSLLAQQQRTGQLRVIFGDGVVGIMFREGMIHQVDDQRRPPQHRVGELLVTAGLVDRVQLTDALKQQNAAPSKPLGSLLVAMSAVSLSDLGRFLDLQFRESLYPLLSATDGRFEFDPEGFATRTCPPPPISVEDVTLETVRRLDEMPAIRAWVTHPTVTYHRVDSAPHPRVEPLSPMARAIYDALEAPANSETLVARLGMDSFTIMKAMAELLQGGHVERVAQDSLDAPAVSPQKARGRRVLAQAGLSFGLSISAVWLFVVLFLGQAQSAGGGFSQGADHAYERQYQLTQNLRVVETALEIYRLENGQYPLTLTALFDFGLSEDDLTYPDLTEHYYYRRTGDDYVLLPSLR